MLTVTCKEGVSSLITSTQNENELTDAEISRRVLAIRSGWTIAERVRRRREAEKRFADLLDALATCEAA